MNAPLVTWPLEDIFRVPATFPAPGFAGEGVQALFFESVPYHGRPTRVFAWLGLPAQTGGVSCPGIVLLHGGGGTAFDEWVRLWNARGYAAIAMDLCGCIPEHPQALDGGPHARHRDGGPPGWGGFDQTDAPLEDQWTYHAVAAALAGHSVLAAQPCVDAERIAITGISWGGYVTCIVAGIDPRLRAAAPVYGCGFLGEDSCWKDLDFPNRPTDEVQRWLDLWDPSRFLSQAGMPMCWLSGTNDFAYPLSSLKKSYLLPTGPRTLCIRVDMPHSHQHGWAPAETGLFMDSVLSAGVPLPRLREYGRDRDRVWAVFDAARPIVKAELCTTRALGHWTDRRWTATPAGFEAADGAVEARLPPHTTAWFLNVFDDRGCVASTPHEDA